MMKKLLMGLLMLLASGAASAAWTYAGESDDRIQYVDRTTIRRNGNFTKMWDLSDFENATMNGGKSTLSRRSQYEYDCAGEKMRRLALTTFSGEMGSGEVTYTDSDTEKWVPVAPGSIGESLWEIACGKE